MEFDATEIANLIKTKQLSPKEAVMNAFSEIKTKNGQLNAVVSLREEKALDFLMEEIIRFLYISF